MHTSPTRPSVTAVVPTHGRPDLLRAALESVAAQSQPPSQLVIVVDGRDPETEAVIRALEPALSEASVVLTVDIRSSASGPSAARNRGVELADSEWCAFLDDDDEWEPTKLARQMAVCSNAGPTFVSAHAAFRCLPSGRRDILPRRSPQPTEPVAEYLFCRNQLGQPKGMLLTPTLLAPTEVFRRHPFDPELRVHEDWDVQLRLDAARIPLVYLDEPLARWNLRSDRQPYTQGQLAWSWRHDLEWAQHRRELLGERGFSGFCLTTAMDRAAGARSGAGVGRLVIEALRGDPSVAEFAGLALIALPERWRDRLARRLAR